MHNRGARREMAVHEDSKMRSGPYANSVKRGRERDTPSTQLPNCAAAASAAAADVALLAMLARR